MKKDKQKIKNQNILKIYTVKTTHKGSLEYKDMLNGMLNNFSTSNNKDEIY